MLFVYRDFFLAILVKIQVLRNVVQLTLNSFCQQTPFLYRYLYPFFLGYVMLINHLVLVSYISQEESGVHPLLLQEGGMTTNGFEMK